ncbi:MAG: hypothetical protein M3122_08075 [Actinomycetota bacterium]|nr:hypothetical protein [Actinomycetota bacterium]
MGRFSGVRRSSLVISFFISVSSGTSYAPSSCARISSRTMHAICGAISVSGRQEIHVHILERAPRHAPERVVRVLNDRHAAALLR